MQLSISTRLTLYYGLGFLLILCTFVVYLYSSFDIGLHKDFEEQLRRDELYFQKALRFEGGFPYLFSEGQEEKGLEEKGEHGTGEEDNEEHESTHFSGAENAYVRLLGVDGRTISSSANLAGYVLFEPQIPRDLGRAVVPSLLESKPAQSLYSPVFSTLTKPVAWLEITRFESGMHSALHRLGRLLTLGTILGAIFAIGLGHILTRRALNPIAKLTQAAKDIEAGNTKNRLPSDFATRDELTDLAETLNHLLARLDDSLERERRFRADAAHQMFTPLAAIQSEIEISLRRKREADEYEQTLAQVLNQLGSLNRLVEGLLQISRAESIMHEDAESVDVGKLLTKRIEDFEAIAEKRNIRLSGEALEQIILDIHSEHFNTVVDNLLENALKYTPVGGEIKVSLLEKEAQLELTVKDSGLGMTDEERKHIFERFYRSDRSEIDKEGGIGLGLSIVHAVVDAYGGSVSVQSDGETKGSQFSVFFPRK